MAITNDEKSSNAVASAAPAGERPSAQLSAGVRQWLERAVKNASGAVGHRYLLRLPQATLSESLSGVPERLERAAHQSRLLLELLDDVRAGNYRELRWYSLPLAAWAMLYSAAPGDIVPDVPVFGRLDDTAVLAVAMRFLRDDLRAYCRFKGYPEAQYFDLPS